MFKKSESVAPKLYLLSRYDNTESDGNHANRDGRPGPEIAPGKKLRSTPNDQKECADQRDISVSIRHSLIAHLNKSDDRHQRPGIPKPASGKPWEAPGVKEYANSEEEKHRARGDNLKPWQALAWKWIKHSQ